MEQSAAGAAAAGALRTAAAAGAALGWTHAAVGRCLAHTVCQLQLALQLLWLAAQLARLRHGLG